MMDIVMFAPLIVHLLYGTFPSRAYLNDFVLFNNHVLTFLSSKGLQPEEKGVNQSFLDKAQDNVEHSKKIGKVIPLSL
jgi:hypothetical protein